MADVMAVRSGLIFCEIQVRPQSVLLCLFLFCRN